MSDRTLTAVVAPATPLPWGLTSDHDIRSSHTAQNDWASEYVCSPIAVHYRAERQREIAPNVAYIVHAANAYPKLVAALRMLHDEANIPWQEYEKRYGDAEPEASAVALLRELGELK